MRLNRIAPIVGLTATAISTVVMTVPVQAATLRLSSGVTSIFLDAALLQSEANLIITDTDGVVPPAPGFTVGLPISPSTTFTYSGENGFTYLGGSIEHTGSITFDNPSTIGSITVGNLLIGFDANRAVGNASGFFIKDTLTTGLVLADAINIVPVIGTGTEVRGTADLIASPELASLTNTPGLAGELIGRVQFDGTQTVTVPEPATMLGLGVTGAALMSCRRKRRSHTQVQH